ncbi:MAG: lipoate--protein ligase family protein [Spirochaetia bacterium]|nr:lipoate--protein ligase family protein [Spirochaetia bacterium]
MIKELLDIKPRNPYLSIALDEAIVQYYEKHPDFKGAIRLWSNPYSIVMGRTCIPEENLKPEFISGFQTSMKKAIWQKEPSLCRRASGGGTVIHGPGNINFSIFISLKQFPELFDLKKSYIEILNLVKTALQAQDVNCKMQGLSDLVFEEGDLEKKISGNAQFRKKGFLAHHGTLITRKNLIHSVSESLLHPPREPDYRNGRSHESFLGSLPEGFDITSFYSILSSEFRKMLKTDESEKINSSDRKNIYCIARNLVKDVYSRKEWILDRKISYGTAVRNDEQIGNLETGT